MAQDRVSLTEGYQGALNKTNRVADEGGNVQNQGKKQLGHAEAFAAQNKGALASQGHNGSIATSNGMTAGGNLHVKNAENQGRFLKGTAAAEETATTDQAKVTRGVESAAEGLNARINRS